MKNITDFSRISCNLIIILGGNFDYGSNVRETHSVPLTALENSEGIKN